MTRGLHQPSAAQCSLFTILRDLKCDQSSLLKFASGSKSGKEESSGWDQQEVVRSEEQADKSFGKAIKDKCKVVLVGRKSFFKRKDFPSLRACQTTPKILHPVFCPWLTLPWYKKDVDKVEQAKHKAAMMMVGCDAAVWGVAGGSCGCSAWGRVTLGGLPGSSPPTAGSKQDCRQRS